MIVQGNPFGMSQYNAHRIVAILVTCNIMCSAVILKGNIIVLFPYMYQVMLRQSWICFGAILA